MFQIDVLGFPILEGGYRTLLENIIDKMDIEMGFFYSKMQTK